MQYAFGAHDSPQDSRTVQSKDIALAGTPLIKGGFDYVPDDILNQWSVGICTAISLVQNRQKANNKKYSADFQYLLQKKYYDLNWVEGSSIMIALKVGVKYGFLPESEWKHTTLADRQLPYSQYIAKLQAIPDLEIVRLLGLCVDKIIGYAAVDVWDSQAIAKALVESQSGLLCRYTVGSEWWTAPVNPLRPPVMPISGHAIGMVKFDYSINVDQILANTWGSYWNKQGLADVIWTTYKPTEIWTILTVAPVIPPFKFQLDLHVGMTSPDVKQLQIILNKNPLTQIAKSGIGSIGNETSYFGALTFTALKKFQALYKIPTTGYCGQMTRAVLNTLL
jgi:peptidoglycan hydrolase-like protein with peptidoglycan-binding domain